MMRIIYYLIVLPLSKLPLSVLYFLSDGLYHVLYRGIGYRKNVVLGNLSRSFPEKSPAEIEAIASDFYRHFCDVIVESIRLFSMPQEEVVRRTIVTNPELCDSYFATGKSLLVIAGHYGSWELIAQAFGFYTKYPTMAIYAPIKDAALNEVMAASRSKFGLELVSTRKVREWFPTNIQRPVAIIFGGDQSPSSRKQAFWMEFLNQETAVAFGTEKFAKEFDYPVVFGDITKTARGHFEVTFHTVTDNPRQEAPGDITRKHTEMLEANIRREPRYWLWTHRRWKRNRQREEAEAQSQQNEQA
jgi:KDO2-lipid IV(A) lauroyltransferase